MEIPCDNAAIEILPPSKIFIDWIKPSPTSPSRFWSGILQSLKIISDDKLVEIEQIEAVSSFCSSKPASRFKIILSGLSTKMLEIF